MEIPYSFSATGAQESFDKYLLPRIGKELHCLQIGVSTGEATEYLLQHVLVNASSTLTDVDTWHGSGIVEEVGIRWSEVEQQYDSRHQNEIATGRLIKCKESTNSFFDRNTQMFDFIYLDGNLRGPEVLQYGMSAIRCLAPQGLLAINDSAWRQRSLPTPGPSPAVSALIDVFSDQVSVLEANNLVWMQRI